MKNSMQIAVYLMLQHLSFVIGTVTLNFNSIGYIGESIVLQCTDTAAIAVNSADWYRGGSQLDISLSRYNQTKIANGFNLTIFPVVSSDGGVYYCGIDFGVSSTKTLTIYYNTKDVNITRIDFPKGIKIAIIAFPDPVYTVTVTTQDGNLTTVNWNISKTTQTSGEIEVLLENSASFQDAFARNIYTVVVSITSPVALVVTKNITWVSNQTTKSITGTPDDNNAAKIGGGVGGSLAVLGAGAGGVALALNWHNKKNKKKGKAAGGKDSEDGKNNGQQKKDAKSEIGVSEPKHSSSDVSGRHVEINMEENSVKGDEERPLVTHNKIGNKDESEIEHVQSKPFDLKERRPLPPVNQELKDKPNHRPQPIPSEKNDVKDQNLRGLSANFDDTRGLASEMPRASRLPPIEHQVQSTVQEEGTSDEPKKNKKNKKKKDKTDEGKSADQNAK